jgi:phage shock protein A
MATFLQKLRTLTLGSAHDLLDHAIDMNSPSAVRQNVRDLEDAIGKMKIEAANEDGHIRTITREQSDLNNSIATDKATVAHLMESDAPTAKEVARGKAAIILQNQSRVSDIAQDIATHTASLTKLNATIASLNQKHDLMVSRVRELESLDRDSKAKESAAKALQSANSLISAAGSTSIDDIQTKMRARNDVANASFDQAIGDIDVSEDPNKSADIDALLNSLTPTTK